MSEEEKPVKYEEFKEFYDRHPDLDNGEYYAEFPLNNKSTLRSWKARAGTPTIPTPQAPRQEEPSQKIDYSLLENEHISLLINQTGTDPRELEGLDNASKIMILKNRLKVQSEDKSNKRTPNSSILPAPRPIGQSNKRFGIDEYIEFDKEKDEIRMQIPIEVLHDPEKNKGLGLIRK